MSPGGASRPPAVHQSVTKLTCSNRSRVAASHLRFLAPNWCGKKVFNPPIVHRSREITLDCLLQGLLRQGAEFWPDHCEDRNLRKGVLNEFQETQGLSVLEAKIKEDRS